MLISDVHRSFLKFFLPTLILIVGGGWIFGKADIERQFTLLQADDRVGVALGATVMTAKMDDIVRDLTYLSASSSLRTALDKGNSGGISEVEVAFVSFSASKTIYDQLRWIDETGMERVRVDYVAGKAVAVARDKLQNKGKRYFFTDAFKLNPGEIFVSPLDLNIEQNQIEIPHKPMLRFATPVVDGQGQKRGIVILNYFGSILLDAFGEATKGASGRTMVLNGEGYWLKSPHSEDEWGFMLNKLERSLATKAPDC